MDFSRLQAGHEAADVRPFDASAMLQESVDQLRPLANKRGLYLRAEGPSFLHVEGDAVNVQRIVQNLVNNAVKYTRAGGVTVSWGDSRVDGRRRWMICVQDTGPGFEGGAGAPMAEVLKEATVESRQADESAPGGAQVRAGKARAQEGRDCRWLPPGAQRGHRTVDRQAAFCELLDASVELESLPGAGATFRIVLPRRYDADTPS